MTDNPKQYVIDNLSAQESWRLFRIMSEVVDGIESLSELPSCVSIFGSARSKPGDAFYEDTENLAHLLVNRGFGVITGGGPGLMEAANKGAQEAEGHSVGLHIQLPQEHAPNPYLSLRCDFRYFFIRKLMFIKYAMAYVVMPGGFGTLDELSEAFVLIQTQRIRPFPLILYGSAFWKGMLDWMRSTMVGYGYISHAELDRLSICDSPEEVIQVIEAWQAKHK